MNTQKNIARLTHDGIKPKTAFVCVHNSCRSQIAECLGKMLASDVFESYSAGTEPKDRINPDAVRLMKEIYGADMEETQHPKLLSAIPAPDIVILMGCNVHCPVLPSQYGCIARSLQCYSGATYIVPFSRRNTRKIGTSTTRRANRTKNLYALSDRSKKKFRN